MKFEIVEQRPRITVGSVYRHEEGGVYLAVNLNPNIGLVRLDAPENVYHHWEGCEKYFTHLGTMVFNND